VWVNRLLLRLTATALETRGLRVLTPELFDTLDGMLMRFAYGWAFAKPARRVYYNLTVTGLSVVVALTIGGIELLSALGGTLDLDGGIWSFVATLDLDVVGFAVVGLFVLTWALALAIWRFGGIERRWSGRLGRAAG
jgi:nickel/cobalt transporter (NiCoT) family protein